MFPIQKDKAAPSRPRAFFSITIFCAVLIITTATSAFAQIVPSKESLSDLYPGMGRKSWVWAQTQIGWPESTSGSSSSGISLARRAEQTSR